MSAETPLIDIRPDHWDIVRDILRKHVPQYTVWAFGSRAKWSAKEYSDLDLAVITDKPLPLSISTALDEDFSESDLPWKVDVVDWASTSDAFRKVIESNKVVVQGEKRCFEQANDWVEDRFGRLVQFVSEKLQAQNANIDTYISTENMLPNFWGITSASTLPLSGSVTRFKVGDTLFSNIRTYFKKVWQAKFDGCCSNDVLVFRSANTEILLPDYLHQICRWERFTELAIRTSKGAKMPRGDKAALADFMFKLPPIEEQRAIAHILGTLDDKIELNRKQNETLEAMARALFKAWFVDFEPVRAKMEGRWQRGQSLPGLSAHLYDLFPDRLIESELGEIPEGWEMRSLDSIANYLNGLALQKFPPESETEFLPVIKIAQLRTGNTNGADKASTKIKPDYVVVDGDVLFSWSGSLEVEVWNGGRGALNQHLFKVTSNEVPKWFYFFATRHHLPDFRAIAAGKATTMGHIQRKHLADARIAVAPPEIMKKFDALISPQFDQMINNAQQSRTFAQLRDTLLPKLISGELRMRDINDVMERF